MKKLIEAATEVVELHKRKEGNAHKIERAYSELNLVLSGLSAAEVKHDQKPFKLYNRSKTSFSFMDRIRILFGQKLHLHTTIEVDRECIVLKSYSDYCHVDEFFPRKSKGMAEKPEIQVGGFL